MQLVSTIGEWRAFCDAARLANKRVGLVPTMGALHEGHASLMRQAREVCDVVVATIFVNPRQFNQASDLALYPRTPEADEALARNNGVDLLVTPTVDEMWPAFPAPVATTVSVAGVSDQFEGAGRPGHFDGVASVVAKLFNVTGPCAAFFGEKDFQQVAVLRQMVSDLAFDVEIVACPIVREENGLALSSRNVRLSPEGRAQALALNASLQAASAEVASASTLRYRMRKVLETAGVEVVYAEIVDPQTLVPVGDHESGQKRALVCAMVEGVRLLDNGPVVVEGDK